MKRFPWLRVLAFTALFLAVACMAAEAQQQREGQRGQRGPGGGQRAPGGGDFGQRGPGGMRGPGMMGGGGVSGLLRSEQVQEELKLTEDQKSQLSKMAEEQRAEMRERMGGMFGSNREEMSEAERKAQQEKVGKIFQELGKKAEEKIRGILEAEQFKRLKQIDLQQQMQNQGPAAFNRPDIIQALGLTEEQQQSLKQIAEGLEAQSQQIREQTAQLFQGYRDASEDEQGKLREKGAQLREKSETERKEAQQKAMAVLTEEQKEKLKGLMGKFIKIEMPRGGPGGQRPGGDRGGQRPGGDRGGNSRPQEGQRRPARPQA